MLSTYGYNATIAGNTNAANSYLGNYSINAIPDGTLSTGGVRTLTDMDAFGSTMYSIWYSQGQIWVNNYPTVSQPNVSQTGSIITGLPVNGAYRVRASADSIFVSTSGGLKAYFSSNGTLNKTISVPSQSYGLCINNGILYVGTVGSSAQIYAYSATSPYYSVSTFSTAGINGSFHAIAAANNTLYVADNLNNRIITFNQKTGALVNSSFITGINGPSYVDVAGKYLLVGYGSGTVGQYDLSSGAFIGNLSATYASAFRHFNTQSRYQLVVATSTKNPDFYTFSTEGTFISTSITSNNGYIDSLNCGAFTSGVITTNHNNINAGGGELFCGALTVSSSSSSIQIDPTRSYANNTYDFTVVGNVLYQYYKTPATKVSTYNYTTGASISPDIIEINGYRMCSYGSNLYFTQGNVVSVFPNTGGAITNTINLGVGTYGLYITNNGIIYVGCYPNNGSAPVIRAYNASNLTSYAGFSDPIITTSPYPSIFHLTVANNIIYAADNANSRIWTFNATTGAIINLTFITGITGVNAVDIYETKLFVGNGSNVSIYDASTGAFISTLFTGPNNAIRVFSNVLGIARSSANIIFYTLNNSNNISI